MPKLPLPEEGQLFIYRDAEGSVSIRSVTDIGHDRTHFTGYCNLRRAERTFRRDRVLELVYTGNGKKELAYHRKAAAGEAKSGCLLILAAVLTIVIVAVVIMP